MTTTSHARADGQANVSRWRDRRIASPLGGLSRQAVEEFSASLDEPPWMTALRLRSLAVFQERTASDRDAELAVIGLGVAVPPPSLGSPGLNALRRPSPGQSPRPSPAGVSAEEESEAAYRAFQEELGRQGVIFLTMAAALRAHPDLVRAYIGSVVPPMDGVLTALNGAVWRGGTFIYVPAGVEVAVPLQTPLPPGGPNIRPFERTLIIAEPGSKVHYIEGCTAPLYTADPLRSAVVEVVVKEGAQVRYTAFQDWSGNLCSVVTKGAVAHRDALMTWVDVDLGARRTIKRSSIHLAGAGARGELLSLACAGAGQRQDLAGQITFAAPHTAGALASRALLADGGYAVYRGRLAALPEIEDLRATVRRDVLLLDPDTRPETSSGLEFEADGLPEAPQTTASQIGMDQLAYMMSRGLTEAAARRLIVMGFIEPIVQRLPLEHTVELDRLLALRLDGSIG
ncbi:MAG: SufD family Fe-S cluster assembly protein [Chloroflexi bacterium]|nr:SufD family Fe-S cluster assembly protein [Chloroflexota bacterium]